MLVQRTQKTRNCVRFFVYLSTKSVTKRLIEVLDLRTWSNPNAESSSRYHLLTSRLRAKEARSGYQEDEEEARSTLQFYTWSYCSGEYSSWDLLYCLVASIETRKHLSHFHSWLLSIPTQSAHFISLQLNDDMV